MRIVRTAALAARLASLALPALAEGDAAKGEKVFNKCKSCHQVGEGAKNRTGPVLNGIVGRTAGTYPDYKYSKANKESGVTWDLETLTVYLRAPREFIPKTKMPFPGLKKDEDIADLLAHLIQFGPDGETVEQ